MIAPVVFTGRNLFADEEAIETAATIEVVDGLSFGRNLFADEEAIETQHLGADGTHDVMPEPIR